VARHGEVARLAGEADEDDLAVRLEGHPGERLEVCGGGGGRDSPADTEGGIDAASLRNRTSFVSCLVVLTDPVLAAGGKVRDHDAASPECAVQRVVGLVACEREIYRPGAASKRLSPTTSFPSG
jgi:hypothetical protein